MTRDSRRQPHHALDIQVLNNDAPISAYQARRQLVKRIVSHAGNPTVAPCYSHGGLGAVAGTGNLAVQPAVEPGKAFQCRAQRLRPFHEGAVAEGCQSLDAQVDAHGPFLAFARNDGHIDLDADGHEPAVGRAADRRARDLALEAQGFTHLHLADAR